MSKRRSIAVTGSGLLLASVLACVRVSSTRLAPSTEPAVERDSVTVFVTHPPATYTELAVLRAHRFLASDGKVLAALRKEASKVGANGLVLLNANAGTQRHSGTGVIIGGQNNGGVVVGNATTEVDVFERAVAIRWK